jgi:hypothetical protein
VLLEDRIGSRLLIVAGALHLQGQLHRGVLHDTKGILIALRSSPHRSGLASLELLGPIDRLREFFGRAENPYAAALSLGLQEGAGGFHVVLPLGAPR